MEIFEEIKVDTIEYNLINLSQLVFEVTDACNLRCKYCGYADLYEGYDKRDNLWQENLCDGIVQPISIGFNDGVPLLNMSFIQEVIAYLESLEPVGKKFHFNMTTNAMLLDKYMDYLVKKEFRLLISLDGDKEGQGYRVDAKDQHPELYKRILKEVVVRG